MDQKELCDALPKTLDAASDMAYWALLLAVVFLSAGLTGQDPISVLGMNIARANALFCACAFYLFANTAIMIQFLRVGDLLRRVDESHIVVAVTKLATHKWPVNPFAFFGTTFASKVHTSSGFGVLIILWWIGNASLYSLADDPFTVVGLALQGAFLGIGLMSMLAVERVYKVVPERLGTVAPDLRAEILSTRPYRLVLTFAGIAIGGAIFQGIQLQRLFF
jgi:hypothetical protein